VLKVYCVVVDITYLVFKAYHEACVALWATLDCFLLLSLPS